MKFQSAGKKGTDLNGATLSCFFSQKAPDNMDQFVAHQD
jgi:hypothetical protein